MNLDKDEIVERHRAWRIFGLDWFKRCGSGLFFSLLSPNRGVGLGIRIVYFSEAQYLIGTIGIDIYGHQVRIYDAVKTLCDCARYQNKLGKDIVKESFTSYFNRPGKNVDKLMEYATKTRAQSIVAQYAEVLL